MKSIVILIAASLLTMFTARAQFGTLDPAFGMGGKVSTDINGADDKGASIAIQGDGKLVVAGFAYNGTDNDAALARYKTDGTLDSTFGTNGKVITPVGSGDDYGLSVVIQPDGKLVVGGYSHNGVNNDFAVFRYKSDGSADSTFGTNGIVTTAIGSYGDNANSIALQADGKIVAAGYSDTTTGDFFALARYNSDGSIDTTFGAGGSVVTHIGLSDDQVNSVKIQNDGKIVAGGYSYNGNDWDFALARYNTDGSPDNTFGINGIVTTDVGSNDNMFYSIALQTDGKIVGAGWAGNEFAAARYNADGNPDTSFGSQGIYTVAMGVSGDGDAMAIQTDGKIIIGGNVNSGTNYDFGLVRLNTDGSADNTFGTGGKVLTDFAGVNDFCLSIAIQADHKIAAAGFTGVNNARDFAIARYDAGNVGIDKVIAPAAVVMYPNPFTDELNVVGEKTSGEIIFYDLTGREIMQQHISRTSTRVNTRQLLPGVYMVKYIFGDTSQVEKTIKTKY